MVARFAGASLGLLAFAITLVTGLSVHNPVTVTLSRGILALFVFCLIGMVLGQAAQIVVDEHQKNRELDIQKRFRDMSAEMESAEVPTLDVADETAT